MGWSGRVAAPPAVSSAEAPRQEPSHLGASRLLSYATFRTWLKVAECRGAFDIGISRILMPAMPRIIANKYAIFRMLKPTQWLRVIIVLLCVAATVMLLLKFPGPLFQKVAKAPRFSPEWTQTLPMDADMRTVKLRQRVADALADLKAKSVHVSENRQLDCRASF